MRVLIIGLGNIGALRGMRLSSLGVPWSWHDPNIETSPENRLLDLSADAIQEFSHLIVSTPIPSHVPLLHRIRQLGFVGPVLVEKPLTLKYTEFDNWARDPRLFVGLTERFNPGIMTIKGTLDSNELLNISFTRTSPGRPEINASAFEDLAIHDIDLLGWLYPNADFAGTYCGKVPNSDSFAVHSHLSPGGQSATFFWSNDTSFKERSVVIRERYRTIFVDLILGTATEKQSLGREFEYRPLATTSTTEDSITRELRAFLQGDLMQQFVASHRRFFSVHKALADGGGERFVDI